MSTQTYTTPKISAKDRLTFTLFLSLVINAVLILGVGFTVGPSDKAQPKYAPTLDVILTEAGDNKTPQEADFLAQVTQSGSGTTQERVRPMTEASAQPLPIPLAGDSDRLQPKQTTQTPATQLEVLTSPSGAQSIPSQNAPNDAQAEIPTAAEMLAKGREIARLNAELGEYSAIYSKRPREKRLTSNTTAAVDAAYVNDWRRKIERIGNLNYPEEAKRRGLSGRLVLDVIINPDGTVKDVTVLRSSGQKLLDDAAIRIVNLAAPFAPLPQEIRKEADLLHIIRTWEFMSGNQLSTSGGY